MVKYNTDDLLARYNAMQEDKKNAEKEAKALKATLVKIRKVVGRIVRKAAPLVTELDKIIITTGDERLRDVFMPSGHVYTKFPKAHIRALRETRKNGVKLAFAHLHVNDFQIDAKGRLTYMYQSINKAISDASELEVAEALYYSLGAFYTSLSEIALIKETILDEILAEVTRYEADKARKGGAYNA